MLLLEITDWGHVWMVTLLGFLIVITLLLVLILVLLLFGKIMANKPQPETPNKWDAPKPEAPSPFSKQVPEADATVAAIAMALAAAQSDDEAAIAMALHLYYNGVHDIQETRLTMVGQSTAWNAKSFGMNNIGF